MEFAEWNKLLTDALVEAYETDFHPKAPNTREGWHAEGFDVSDAIDMIAEDYGLPYVDLSTFYGGNEEQLPDNFFRTLEPDEDSEFRQWAQNNYKSGDEISELWHPTVRDECAKINQLKNG